MAPASTSASGSGSSFVPLTDAPATAMKVPDSGLSKTAVQSAASGLLAGQNTVLAALLALKGAQPMSSTRPSVGGAGLVPAATLPSGLLSILKDTVLPTVVTQTTQRSGEVRNAIPSPVLQSLPSLPQQLVNVPSALKSTLPNPLGSQAAVKTPENLAARASASPSAFQHGKATSAEMSAQHHQAGVGFKADSIIVSTRYASNMIPMEANPRPMAAMLGPNRQADSPVGSKAALPLSAGLSKQSVQIRTQTLQVSSISDTRYRGQQSSASSVPPKVSARPSSVNPSKEALEYKPSLHNVMQSKSGGTMLSPEGLNMMARPNTVYVEGAAAGVRVEPEQARLLGLRAGETINAVVTQRQDGNVLLVGKQQLPLPERMNLPPGQVSLLVRVISGQPVLALTDPALAAQVAAAHQRTDSDGRFARLLNHIGSFHLSRVFSPGHLPALAAQAGGPEIQRGLASLLLDSRNLNSRTLRQMVQNMGLFGEHHASLNPGQTAPGLKSMMLALRALMQARQMETTSLSGAIDEIEARQIDSLAQQVAGRSHYSWVIPFSDQHPVFIELEHHNGTEAEGTEAQESWTVDLEVGLTETVSMAANVRVSHEGILVLRLWLPEPTFYRLAEAGKAELEAMLSGQSLSLGGLTIYPVARDAGSVNYGQQRMGVSIDA